MSMGHPYFNRDVGSQLNNDALNNALNQQASLQMAQMQNQSVRANLYGLSGGGRGGSNGCSVSSSDAYTTYIRDDFVAPKLVPTIKKDQSMFKEIVCDVKGFILEHRSVIYFLAFALLVDHFVFRGAFKARLQGCVDRLVTKVEEKIQ